MAEPESPDDAIEATEDLRELSELRLREARTLLSTDLWSGAYYLAGYALELGFKAAATKTLQPYRLPGKKFVSDFHTHNLPDLAKLAGLREQLNSTSRDNPQLGVNWGTASKWTEQARYHRWTEEKAREIVDAIGDETNGVLPWIKTHW